MSKSMILSLVLVLCSAIVFAEKQKGTTTLKDVQPAGTTDKKQKNQIYDLLFTSADKNYTCRTSPDTKLKATDFIVGEEIGFEFDSDKAKLKSSQGKEVKCKIVRVEKVPARN